MGATLTAARIREMFTPPKACRTQKMQFTSKADALAYIQESPARRDLVAYQCDLCAGFWHLSNMRQRKHPRRGD